MEPTPRTMVRDIEERSFSFAVRIVRLCRLLEKKNAVARSISIQLLRAGTSVGANIEESRAAESRADFVHKNTIALKEIREASYWLRLLRESAIIEPRLLAAIIRETEELAKILGAIVSRTRRSRP